MTIRLGAFEDLNLIVGCEVSRIRRGRVVAVRGRVGRRRRRVEATRPGGGRRRRARARRARRRAGRGVRGAVAPCLGRGRGLHRPAGPGMRGARGGVRRDGPAGGVRQDPIHRGPGAARRHARLSGRARRVGGLGAVGIPMAIAVAQFTIRTVLLRLVSAVAFGAALNVVAGRCGAGHPDRPRPSRPVGLGADPTGGRGRRDLRCGDRWRVPRLPVAWG